MRRRICGWSQLLAAAICIASLVHRMVWGLGSQTLASDNFFAYLTIQSNVAFAIVSTIAGITALQRATDPAWLNTLRMLVLSWTVTAGLAFSIIVWQAGERGIPITIPWSDVVLHYVLPAVAVLSWSLDPGRGRVPWRALALVLVYPAIWGVFTIWRGRIIGWYPYYFLDPRQVSGLPEMALSCLAALSIFALVAATLVFLSRLPRHDSATAPAGRSTPARPWLRRAPRGR